MDQARSTGFILLCWIAYIVLAPLQFFPSGYPQPADVMLLLPLLAAFCISLRGGGVQVPIPYIVLGLFAGLALAVNLTWFAFYRERGFLLSSLFYIYNACVFLLCVFILKRGREKAKKWMLIALGISIALEVLWLVFISDALPSGRNMGSFSNPNQLAYWALTTLLCFLALRQDAPFGRSDALAFLGTGFIIAMSLSKAGMISFAICVLVIFFSRRVSARGRLTAFLGFVVLTVVAFAPMPDNGPPLIKRFESTQQVISRLQRIGVDRDDSLDARGYTRLIEAPEYLLFGAGEGAYRRFVPYGPRALEIHSGFANALFSYGILGFCLLSAFFVMVFRGSPAHVIALFLPIVFYSLTHQTFRFTTFWIFIGIVYAMTSLRARDRLMT